MESPKKVSIPNWSGGPMIYYSNNHKFMITWDNSGGWNAFNLKKMNVTDTGPELLLSRANSIFDAVQACGFPRWRKLREFYGINL